MKTSSHWHLGQHFHPSCWEQGPCQLISKSSLCLLEIPHPSFTWLVNYAWEVRARRGNQVYSWWFLILTALSAWQPQLPLWRQRREGKWGRAVKDRQHSSFSCVFQFTSLLHFCSAFVLFSSHVSFLKHLLTSGDPQEACGLESQLLPPIHIQNGFPNHFTGTISVLGYLSSLF